MPTQPVLLTYEGILELFRETDRKFQETDRKIQETAEQMKETSRKMAATDRKMKRTDKRISDLGGRIGDIVASMVQGNIVKKFQTLGYDIDSSYENFEFSNSKLGIDGEIDLTLENGDVAILIEVKTTLEMTDVRKHVERMEKYRRWADAKGVVRKRYIGAVAGAVVKGEAKDFAHKNGMYVIVQSGEAVKIVTLPEGFTAKEW